MAQRECLDCHKDTYQMEEYYMVTDAVWEEANPDHAGMLCIGCLEERLGRELEFKEFLWCPLNVRNVYEGSERLRDRLGRAILFK